MQIATEKHEAIRLALTEVVDAREIVLRAAEGHWTTVEALVERTLPLVGVRNRLASGVICGTLNYYLYVPQGMVHFVEYAGKVAMRKGHLNDARQRFHKAFAVYADRSADGLRDCAMMLVLCNCFQRNSVKYRIDEDAVAVLTSEETQLLRNIAVACRRVDGAKCRELLPQDPAFLGLFLHDFIAKVSRQSQSRSWTKVWLA